MILLRGWKLGPFVLSAPCPLCGQVHTGSVVNSMAGRCGMDRLIFVVDEHRPPFRIEAAKYKQSYATVARDLRWFEVTPAELVEERRGLRRATLEETFHDK